MKTPMQEAIDFLRQFGLEASAAILEEKFLQVEKKKMIDFAFDAYQGVSQLSEVPKNLIAESKAIFESNFDRIYNQNK